MPDPMTPTPDPAAPAVEVVEAMARAIFERPMAMMPHGRPGDWDRKGIPSHRATRTRVLADAAAALTALRTHLAANPHHAAALLPDGWCAVPREPTVAMLNAACRVDEAAYVGGSQHGATDEDIYAAMINAASPPASGRIDPLDLPLEIVPQGEPRRIQVRRREETKP
jgi:hypothetical protein